MAIALRQSTASQEVVLGYFVDSTDGNTEETGLTIANTDIKIWKNGATTLANKNSGGATHISNGIYYATLDATDTNTVGPMIIFCHESGALAVRLECHVFEEDIYDALFGASAAGFDSNMRVDVGSWLGTAVATPTVAGVPEMDMTHLGGVAQSATDLKDFADAGYDPATNKVEGVKLADTCTANTDMVTEPPTVAEIQAEMEENGASVLDTLQDRLTAARAGYLDALNGHTAQTGDSYARIGAPAGASVSADVAAVKAETAAIVDDTGTNGVIVTELKAAALADMFNTDSGTDYASAVAGSPVKETSDNAAGASLTNASIADAVWDEAIADHTAAGSTGEELTEAATASLGAGAIEYTYTVTSTEDGTPIADCHVWATTDINGLNIIANGTTDQDGEVTFQLDAGTTYIWRAKTGYTFTNPDTETVS